MRHNYTRSAAFVACAAGTCLWRCLRCPALRAITTPMALPLGSSAVVLPVSISLLQYSSPDLFPNAPFFLDKNAVSAIMSLSK